MIHRISVYESTGFDPYYNIATEKYLLEHVAPGECILYLWQNKNTVVIGRNQNAWVECRTTLLEQESGKLARRLSGGGAVFHDLGNLNFTFLMHDEDYDLDRQFNVIMTACRNLGISVEKSCRNDLLAEGRKFSGNAFYHTHGRAYHHGTLLVEADMEKLSRYLTPSKAKLASKGVSSVRSRVTNLKELCPALSIDILKQQMRLAFSQVYGLQADPIILSNEAFIQIEASAVQLGDWQWCYGPRLPFSFSCESQFTWGNLQLQLQITSGCICIATVYSDAIDWALADSVSNALHGCRFTIDDMTQALIQKLGDNTVARDISTMLAQQQL